MARNKYIFPHLGLLIVIIIAGCQPQKGRYQRDLSYGWEFKQSGSENWHTAKVPGVVHTDLLENDLIADPFIGTNEDSVQWVEEKEWQYKTNFTLTDEEKDYANIDLVFEGLDTYAKVFLNGRQILKANNMFRRWRVDIKDYIISGENELRVVFTPPIEQNKARLKQLGYTLPAGSETGDWPVSPFTRKAAYQFGWDFAPRLVTMGIWRPVHFDFWQEARIEDVRFELNELSSTKATYRVHLSINSATNNSIFQVEVLAAAKDITLVKGLNSVTLDIIITNPKLWWPNGLGEPTLYDIPIRLSAGGEVIDSLGKRLGIRTVELVQEADEIGESFYFKINNDKIFAKGANWSPLSSFPGSIADSTYVNRIRTVKAAHMNMLRVWGGGIYERDLFYDLCDENGIMIWQDFMFANSMYPGDQAFLENVKIEVRQQVQRLQSHPSIVLWNGNNEIEVAWNNWGWQKQFGYSAIDSTQIWLDYLQLFEQAIPEIINQYDPGRAYTSTSPLSNWGTRGNFNSGSMHYWGVWHGSDTFNDYKYNVGRFMAEYGFQSYPQASTMKSYFTGNDLDLGNTRLAHQKSYVGNGLITQEITRYFGSIGPNEFPLRSQQVQAIALKTAIEAHRLNKDTCGGTLFWQLNDCWPGPSWSVIDYFGHKKLAYEVVKDRYKPIIIIPERVDNKFDIWVVNDLLNASDVSLKIELFRHNDDRLWVTEKLIKINPNTVNNVYRSDIRKILDGMPKEEVYLKLTLIKDNEILDLEKFYFVKPKDYKGDYDLVGVD